MKDIARILRLAVWRSHAVAVVAAVVSMLAAIAPATHAKDISPMEAVRIARRVVTLSDDCAAKARAQSRTATPIPPFIYITTRGDRDLSSLPATTRWEKSWPTAGRPRSTR